VTRTIYFCLLLAPILAFAQTPRRVTDAEVQRVHRSILLLDTHNDVPNEQKGKEREAAGFDIGPRTSSTHTDLPRLREGRVGGVFFVSFVNAPFADHGAYENGMSWVESIHRDLIERYPKDFALATTAAEIEAAHKHGKIAALIGLEGGHAIEDSLDKLRAFHRRGVRYMTLTWANTNHWGDSSGDINKPEVLHHNGLTAFVKDVVREMNRIGMMVDVSHVSDKTFWDALEVSKAPLIASHSSSRAMANVPRNMTDEMIAALAKKGGVIQVNFNCGFLTEEKPAHATLADAVRHIDHIRKVGGIGVLGIGSDFDGVDCTPDGLEDVSKYPNLTRALLEKGYSAEDIRKIYSGNLLRVMKAVEKVATVK
jgi:membrane dipeptidase